MPDDTQLPDLPSPPLNIESVLGHGLPNALRILIDDKLFDRVRLLARYMAEDTAFTPRHLREKPQACFTVLSQALNWKLDPHFVARCTYETPGGSIGFMGSLVQAILEQSGRLVGGIEREYVGDWSSIVGKFQKKTSAKGNEYVVPSWTQADAQGLGIIIRARLKGEDRPRVWPAEGEAFMLTQCFPLNSPLWATDPKSQIAYLAVRRFANQAAPGLLGGMPFDEDALLDASERARDVTPMATLQEPEKTAVPAEEPEYEVTDHVGDVYRFERPEIAVEACRKILIAVANDPHALATAWTNNQAFIADLAAFEDLQTHAQSLERLYHELRPQTTEPPPSHEEVQEPPGAELPSEEPDADEEPPPRPTEAAGHPSTPEPSAGTPTAAPVPTAAATAAPAVPSGRVDPFWNGRSLEINPPPVHGGGSLRKLDWSKWPAVLLPKMHNAPSPAILARLWYDNQANLDRYAEPGSKPRLELEAEYEMAKKAFTD